MGNVAERTMEARVAERADFGPWLELAAEVEPLFGPMARDPVFQRALSRNIARGHGLLHPGARRRHGLAPCGGTSSLAATTCLSHRLAGRHCIRTAFRSRQDSPPACASGN
jgi:hypothetical protein